MLQVNYCGMMGNQMIQYSWARCLAEEIGYQLSAPPIEGFPRTYDRVVGKYYEDGELPVLKVFRKDFNDVTTDLGRNGERKIVVSRSPLEHYPTLAPYRDKIRSWFAHDDTNLDLAGCDIRRKVNGTFVPEPVNAVEKGDLVISLRLGGFTWPKYQYRLLTSNFFDIILSSAKFTRLFITSDEIEHELVDEFEKYRPLRFFQKDRWQTMKFIAKFDQIAISQSTYSWWCAYLSDASRIYFPISDGGVWNRELILKSGLDLRVNEDRFVYVHYDSRRILGGYEHTLTY